MEKKVIIYSTDWCGYCSAEKEWLAHNKIDFVEKKVDQDPEAYEEFIKKIDDYLNDEMGSFI